jgi:uncharacterized protein YjbI with pentapeptide repeats
MGKHYRAQHARTKCQTATSIYIMRLITLFFLFLFGHNAHVQASAVLASTFGYNTTDATTAFKTAIQSPNDTIIIDYVVTGLGVWKVGPCNFFDLQNKVIIFQSDVKLTAKPGAFPDTGDCLFRLIRANNVSIWGTGAIFVMQKSEYTTGEWRHALAISNSTDVDVHGLYLKDSGGDGIYISGDPWWGTQLYSDQIFIENCISENNRRQGMSVISAQNLTVTGCTFRNTIGTLPEAGLDLEPDNPQHRMVNVVFSYCTFAENNGKGISLSFAYLSSASLPISVTFNHCNVLDNYDPSNIYSAGEIDATASCTDFPTGTVNFNDCTVSNSQWSAVVIRKPAASYMVNFNNCNFTNVSQVQAQYNNPIWIEVCDYSNPNGYFGGLTLNNTCIEFPTNLAWLWANGWATSPGLGEVTTNVGVINPYQLTPVYSNVGTQQNVTVNWVQGCAALPVEYLSTLEGRAIQYGIELRWTTATERFSDRFEVERSNDGLAFEAISSVRAKGHSNQAINYRFLDEKPQSGRNYYRIRQVDQDGKASASDIVSVDWPANSFQVYPNPVADHFNVQGNTQWEKIIVRNAQGQIVRTFINSDNTTLINLASGVYTMEIFERASATTPVIIRTLKK